MKNFEIAWRNELIKRLQAPMNTLNRKYEHEQKQFQNRIEELHKYSSPEEAHEAYGYGYITLEEYDQICHDFNNSTDRPTPISAARDELKSVISRLEKDIRYFKWEELTDEEKQRIEQSNEKYKQELNQKLT